MTRIGFPGDYAWVSAHTGGAFKADGSRPRSDASWYAHERCWRKHGPAPAGDEHRADPHPAHAREPESPRGRPSSGGPLENIEGAPESPGPPPGGGPTDQGA